MNNANFKAQYAARLQRVLEYIYDHLDDDLDLDTLAEIACMSRYHWHRVFRAMTGEPIAKVVRRLRLSKAAHQLIAEDTPVRDVAAKFGFKNLSSFSRAFKLEHGMSPNEFRARGKEAEQIPRFENSTLTHYSVRVDVLPPAKAAGVLHRGSYGQIGRCFQTLGGIIFGEALTEYVNEVFVVYHSPPDCAPMQDLRSHVAVSIKPDFPKNVAGLEYFDVVGGKYAILDHVGPYAQLKSAYDYLYGHWLPLSGEEPRDEPPLEVYVSDPKVTPSAELRTQIRLPLE